MGGRTAVVYDKARSEMHNGETGSVSRGLPAAEGSHGPRVHFRGSPEAVHGPNPFEDGPSADSYGTIPIQGLGFLIPAPSAGARSLLIPGTCDLTQRRTDASDSAAPAAWNSPTIPAP